MKIKYKAKHFGAEIIKTEITRETDKSVFFNETYFGEEREGKSLKVTSTHQYFDTWEEAKQYHVQRLMIKADRQLFRYKRTMSMLKDCIEMVNPEKNYDE